MIVELVVCHSRKSFLLLLVLVVKTSNVVAELILRSVRDESELVEQRLNEDDDRQGRCVSG